MVHGRTLDQVRERFSALVAEHELLQDPVRVRIGPLSPRQAIGQPARQDFALLVGREVMVEAEFRGSFGHAFTDDPLSFEGTVGQVEGLELDSGGKRAVYIATLNAVSRHLGMVEETRHCKDEEPERCGSEMALQLLRDYGRVRVGLVGYQPAILEHLAGVFGPENVRCTDLSPGNVGSDRFGVPVWDGRTDTDSLVDWCELLLVTSSTLVNGTFDEIHERAVQSKGKPLVLFGVTGAGVAALLGLKRLCLYGG